MNVYILRNKNGNFGGGQGWFDTIDKAKIYTKKGLARSAVSWFFNNQPELGVVDLLEFTLDVEKATVLNEDERVFAQKRKKLQEQEQAKIRSAERQKEYLQNQIRDAQERLSRISI